MLLQLSEPSTKPQTSIPYQAIGIDLGTTHSVVAYVKNTTIQFVDMGEGEKLLPSAIAYSQEKFIIGQAAFSFQEVLLSVKRRLKTPNEKITLNNHITTPFLVLIELFKEIKKRTEDHLKYTVKQAVITVPAYFDEGQRRIIKKAAEKAEFDVLRLINEPTAAALAYGIDTKKQGYYLIYDLGGGTFDISLLKLQGDIFQVIATGGDPELGGDDFDLLVKDHLNLENIKQARTIKHILSDGPTPQLDLKTYENLIEPLIDTTISILTAVLKEAQINLSVIEEIILVGGATRTPLIKKKLKKYFNKDPLCTLDPDLVVAMGAAYQAEALTQGSQHLLLDVTPLSLGIEMMGGLVEKIIYRNTPIPACQSQEFTTHIDGQTSIRLHILQGEMQNVDKCRSLAHFDLKDIPPMNAGIPEIEVQFQIDADGLLTVTAHEKRTGTSQKIEVNPSYGLTENIMQEMIEQSINQGAEDLQQRIEVEKKLKAENLIYHTQNALNKDGNLLKPDEKTLIGKLMKKLQEALKIQDMDLISTLTEKLDQATHDFAHQRIHHTLKKTTKEETEI